MGAGVVQVLAFQVNLRAAQVAGHLLRVVQPGGAAGVFIKQLGQLPVELRVVFVVVVRLLQLDDCVHQRLWDILSAVYPEPSLGIGHSIASFLTAATNCAIFSWSFRPSVSMPELTSTP